MCNFYNQGRVILTVLFSFLAVVVTLAQGIRGRVTDTNTKVDLPGVSVLVVGSTNGASTDANGEYSIRIGAGRYILRISSVGYLNRDISVVVETGGTATVNIELIENQASLSEVVVVGSRSTQVRTSTETVAPIDVIQSRDLVATGQVDITQQLNFVAPSFNSARQTVADGTDHIDPATIRGLGPDQVLVLLNGKRRHNQALVNINGTVGRGSVGTDLNTIPSAAVERIEVLRDGAASQYGSDAIAGVINLRLKERIGLSANAQIGQQYAGDGQIAQIGINNGFKLGSNGFLSLTGELRYRGATNRAGDYTGPVYANWNAGRATGETDDAWIARRQTLYNSDQAQIRSNNFNLSKNMQIGNSQVTNAAIFLNARLPLGRKASAYATGGYNFRNGKAAGFYRYPFQTAQVIKELYPNGFLPGIESVIGDASMLVGVNGDANGYRWDISNVYGMNSFRFDVTNSNNASQFALGASAPTSFYAGTIQFGQNTSNASVAKDYGQQMGLQSFNVAVGAEYRLDMYKIKAGDEASYRNFDPASGRGAGAQVFPGFQPTNAVDENRRVLGAFIDIESDLTEQLLVNAALRIEDYSDFGSNVAGKLAARYKFDEAFSIRGAISNGFRAPSIHQRYFSAVATQFVSVPGEGLVPRQVGTFRNDGPVAAAFGVPSLKAERSKNYSVGITSRIAGRSSLTLDLYQIDIDDRIIYTGQFQRSNATVARILDGAGQRDVNAAAFFTNAVNTVTRGIDLVFTTSPRLEKGQLDVTLAANFNKTQVVGEVQRPANIGTDPVFGNLLFNRQDRARLELAQPRSKISLTGNYRRDKFGVVVRFTHFGVVETYDPADRRLDEFFAAKLVTDFSVSYRVLPQVNLTLGANNLFDVYPDKLRNAVVPAPNRLPANTFDNSSFGRFVYSRNATQFGYNGGYYFLNVSANF